MCLSVVVLTCPLGGLDLASQLLKEVLPALQAQFPSLTTFSTLSPMPNFMGWLSKAAKVRLSFAAREVVAMSVCFSLIHRPLGH